MCKYNSCGTSGKTAHPCDLLLLLLLLTVQSCDELELPLWLEEKLKSEWTQQQVILMREDQHRKFRTVKFTGRKSTSSSAQMFVHCSDTALREKSMTLKKSLIQTVMFSVW